MDALSKRKICHHEQISVTIATLTNNTVIGHCYFNVQCIMLLSTYSKVSGASKIIHFGYLYIRSRYLHHLCARLDAEESLGFS